MRTKMRRKIARANARLQSDRKMEYRIFVAARLFDGRWFRLLAVVGRCMTECLLLLADGFLTVQKVALALARAIAERGAQTSVDNRS